MCEIVVAVNSLSYNQLVERIIANKASEDSALVSQVTRGNTPSVADPYSLNPVPDPAKNLNTDTEDP